jgi:hypothetical protein
VITTRIRRREPAEALLKSRNHLILGHEPGFPPSLSTIRDFLAEDQMAPG